MEEIIQGKHFSITDPPEVNTVIYQVNKTPKEELKENSPKFTVERLDFTEEIVGEKIKIPQKGYKDGRGSRGDLIAEVKTVVPKKLTEEEKELFEQLKSISKFNPRTAK